jgi:hypothetical protein
VPFILFSEVCRIFTSFPSSVVKLHQYAFISVFLFLPLYLGF